MDGSSVGSDDDTIGAGQSPPVREVLGAVGEFQFTEMTLEAHTTSGRVEEVL